MLRSLLCCALLAHKESPKEEACVTLEAACEGLSHPTVNGIEAASKNRLHDVLGEIVIALAYAEGEAFLQVIS